LGDKYFITLYKNRGLFYNCYDNDAYILSLIFGYRVLDGRKCGFPESVFNKIIETLENYKISYQVIYTNKEPLIKDYNKLNNYKHFYNLSMEMMDRQNKIDLVIRKMNDADKEDIEQIIKIIDNVSNK